MMIHTDKPTTMIIISAENKNATVLARLLGLKAQVQEVLKVDKDLHYRQTHHH